MIEYRFNTASKEDIRTHLTFSSENFIPPLSTYINITDYASKISAKSDTFEAWHDGTLVGLLASYNNERVNSAYITNVSLDGKFQKQGIGKTLLQKCIEHYRNIN